MKKLALLVLTAIIIFGCGINAPGSTPSGNVTQPVNSTSNVISSAGDKTLTVNNLNTALPDDVVHEIAYFGGLGGGGGNTLPCLPTVYPSPAFSSDSSQGYSVELFSDVGISVCGLAPDETVDVEVKLPDGSVRNFHSVAKKADWQAQAEMDFDYILGLNDPTGRYDLTFSGNGWTLQQSINVIEPDSPRLYLVDNNKIIFYHFHPNENVRLLVFRTVTGTDYLPGFIGRNTQELIGWEDYQLGSDGGLSVNVDIEGTVRYIALGDVSGQVIYRLPNFDPDYLYWSTMMGDSTFSCKDAPNPVGIKPDSFAKVIFDNLPLFSGNATGGPNQISMGAQIGTLPKGTVVRIDSNATCFKNTWWWGVSCTTGDCQGFVEEANSQGPNLEPEQNASANSGSQNSSFSCLGAPPTRFEIGQTGRVTFTQGQSDNLRNQIGLSGKIIAKIPEGTKFTIVDGPQCQDGFVWWKIQLSDGRAGWVAEGDSNSYFIEPYP